MREILFRGKQQETGRWVEGSLVIWHDGSTSIEVGDLDTPMLSVITETVGQFTGLTDRNGTKIFEGDVLNVLRSGVKWRCMVNDIRHMPWQIYGSSVERIEVIGNIHDNPELIGGGEDAE